MTELSTAQIIAVSIIPVLFAITLHEVAHGWVASKCGDQTARLSGRLTINPMKHIDLVGTVIVPIIFLIFFKPYVFGWAKPVPVDARNMRNPRRDMAIVSVAGPIANFLMALFWAGIAKCGVASAASAPQIAIFLAYAGEVGIIINILLMVLNCLPIPPLDGGRFVMSVLPGRMAFKIAPFERYAFIILLLLMVTGVLSAIISPPFAFFVQWIFELFGLPYLNL
jgi:Zn-dependent protease